MKTYIGNCQIPFLFLRKFILKKKKPISRSENMRRIRSKDTKIEVMLRRELWRRGLRYRKNAKGIPGRPDIAFPGAKVAVFVDSEFWHGKFLMEGRYIPKTNREFWVNKIKSNIERDKAVNKKLEEQGWTVVRFWGEEVEKLLDKCADKVEAILKYKKEKK